MKNKEFVIEQMMTNIHGASDSLLHLLKHNLGKSYDEAAMKVRVGFLTLCPDVNLLYEDKINIDILFFVCCVACLQDSRKRGNGNVKFQSFLSDMYQDKGKRFNTSDSARSRIRNMFSQDICIDGTFLHRLAHYVRLALESYGYRLDVYALFYDLLIWNNIENSSKEKWAQSLVKLNVDTENVVEKTEDNSDD